MARETDQTAKIVTVLHSDLVSASITKENGTYIAQIEVPKKQAGAYRSLFQFSFGQHSDFSGQVVDIVGYSNQERRQRFAILTSTKPEDECFSAYINLGLADNMILLPPIIWQPQELTGKNIQADLDASITSDNKEKWIDYLGRNRKILPYTTRLALSSILGR